MPSIRVEKIGDEAEPVVVIEDFHPDPDGLIREAERSVLTPRGEYYPGVRAPVTPDYFQVVGPILAQVAAEVFGARERMSVTRGLWSLADSAPETLSLGQRIPHVDGVEPGLIAVVHYLSQRDHGGTAFYRHRSTGFETIDQARRDVYFDALTQDFDRLGEPEPAYIAGDTPLFERTARFDPVFNRAIVYRSRLLHCAEISNTAPPPRDVREGRLTVASFLTAR